MTPSLFAQPWFLGTIDIRTGKAQDYIRELKYLLLLLCSIVIGETLSLPLELCRGMLGRRRRSRLGYGTKGKQCNPAKAFEVLDNPSACLSQRLNPFLKCIKCLSVKFGPDSVCDSLWRHLNRSFPDAVWIHTGRVWSKVLAPSGTMRSWSRYVISARTYEISAAWPHKIRVRRALGF